MGGLRFGRPPPEVARQNTSLPRIFTPSPRTVTTALFFRPQSFTQSQCFDNGDRISIFRRRHTRLSGVRNAWRGAEVTRTTLQPSQARLVRGRLIVRHDCAPPPPDILVIASFFPLSFHLLFEEGHLQEPNFTGRRARMVAHLFDTPTWLGACARLYIGYYCYRPHAQHYTRSNSRMVSISRGEQRSCKQPSSGQDGSLTK